MTEDQKRYGYYYDSRAKVDKGHAGEIEAFRLMIVEDRPVETDVVRGALATILAWRAIESVDTGRAIDLDFTSLLGHQKLPGGGVRA